MTIVLDKDLSTEIELPIDNCFEHLSIRSLNVSKTVRIPDEVIPDLSSMYGRTTVGNLHVYDNLGSEMPIIGTYSVIDDFTTSITDREFTFSISFRESGN